MFCGAGQPGTALRGAIAVALAVTVLARPIHAQEQEAGEGALAAPPQIVFDAAAEDPGAEDLGAEDLEAEAMPADPGPPPVPSGPVIAVPSGVAVQWLETRSDTAGPQGLTLRFRFVAPAIAGADYGPEKATADLQALCDGWALPRVAATGPQPAELVLDLADRPVVFGAPDETAVQFFEAYSIADGACQWELF